MPQEAMSRISWPMKMKRLRPSLMACITVLICVATTLSTCAQGQKMSRSSS